MNKKIELKNGDQIELFLKENKAAFLERQISAVITLKSKNKEITYLSSFENLDFEVIQLKVNTQRYWIIDDPELGVFGNEINSRTAEFDFRPTILDSAKQIDTLFYYQNNNGKEKIIGAK